MIGRSYTDLLNVPVFMQSDDSMCGPSAMKSILYYYGIDTTADHIAEVCKHTYERGCSNENIVEAFKRFDLEAEIIADMSFNDLKYWTDHKVPVLIDWFCGDDTGAGYGHASVVVGCDNQNIFFVDPLKPKITKIKYDEFEPSWFDYDFDNKLLKHVGIIVFADKLKKK